METDFHEFELHGWDYSATAYDKYFTLLTLKAFDKIVQNGKIARGARVLDVACGPGHLTNRLASLGAEVIGIDFSASMINLSKANYTNISFHIGDAHNLPFVPNSFDVVVMNFGILHLAAPEKAIAEAFRVLRPEGRFVVTVWGKPDVSKGLDLILGAINKTGAQPSGPEGPPFFKFSDNIESDRALKEAGFKKISIEDLQVDWILPDSDALFRAFFEGTARTGGMLRSLDKKSLDMVRRMVSKNVAKYEHSHKISVPMNIKIISGVKK